MNSPISKEISTSEIIECPSAPRKSCPYKSFPTPQAGPTSSPLPLDLKPQYERKTI